MSAAKRGVPGKGGSDDAWIMADAEEDDVPVLYRMRTMFPPGVEAARYPHLVNVFWKYDGSAKGGMPRNDLYEDMMDFEERLQLVEGPEVGFLALVITGNNRREWIFYVSDPEVFKASANVALSGLDQFPVEIEAAEDPEWKTLHGLLASVSESDA